MSPGEMMAPREVAALFGVDPKTVTRWGKTGKLPSLRTLGGHLRFPRPAVMALLRGEVDGGPVRVDGQER